MKTVKTLQTLAIALVLCLGQISFAQGSAQNPTATEDIKVVDDYLDAIMTNKMDLAANLMADAHIGAGPSAGETQTKAEIIAGWIANHKVRTNQKNDYVKHTWRVVEGEYLGDWVAVWGTYSYTKNGVDIELPYQFTAQVDEGKIQRSIIYYDKLAVNKAMGFELTAKKQ